MNLLLLVIFLLISAAFGMRILEFFNFSFYNFREKVVYSISLGLGFIAYAVFILGLTGLLHRWYLILLLLALATFSFKQLTKIVKEIWNFRNAIKFKQLDFFYKIILFLIIIAVILTFISALAPPIGHDSLSYRLAQIRVFSETNKVDYIPYSRESLWPYLIEMLFALGLAVSSDIFVKLIAWSFGIISAFAIYVFTQKLFSERSAIISTALFLLTPAIFTQMTYAYVDIPFAFFSFISLTALLRFFETKDIKWALLAGVFCGFVLSIKYTGVISLLALLAVWIYFIVRRFNFRRYLKSLVLFLLIAALCSFAWYLRSYLIKGNPTYPFFALAFNGNGWPKGLENHIGSGFSVLKLLMLPWNLTMLPNQFGGEQLGVIYLLFSPFVFLVHRNKDVFKKLAVFAFSYAVVWFYLDPFVVRFLFPIILVLAVIVGSGIHAAISRKGYFSGFIKLLLVIALIFNASLLAYYNKDMAKVAIGMQPRQDYLAKNERTYNVAEYINKNLPEDVVILMIGEVRSYYIKRPYIHFKNFIYEEQLPAKRYMSRDFLRQLKKYDIDYVLCRQKAANKYPWLRSLQQDKDAVFSTFFQDKEREEYNYSLYSLK